MKNFEITVGTVVNFFAGYSVQARRFQIVLEMAFCVIFSTHLKLTKLSQLLQKTLSIQQLERRKKNSTHHQFFFVFLPFRVPSLFVDRYATLIRALVSFDDQNIEA
jgi:hypothetical protein